METHVSKGVSWDSAAQIARSENGRDFQVVHELHRSDLAAKIGDDVIGVEGQQLIRDPGAGSLIFLGMENRTVIDGTICGDLFVAYRFDLTTGSLQSLVRTRWEPDSPYEHPDHPIHTYMDIVPGPTRDELLIFLEGMDPSTSQGIGLDMEVDRLLLYTVPLAEKA